MSPGVICLLRNHRNFLFHILIDLNTIHFNLFVDLNVASYDVD